MARVKRHFIPGYVHTYSNPYNHPHPMPPAPDVRLDAEGSRTLLIKQGHYKIAINCFYNNCTILNSLCIVLSGSEMRFLGMVFPSI
ncbi:MAG: hypothetical protein ACMUJM_16630 [bacterium]